MNGLQLDKYSMLLLGLLIVCGVMVYQVVKMQKKQDVKTVEFYKFQRKYLVAFVLCIAADWAQGPFIYKLYSFYGYSKGEIGFLFVTGFLSSAIFGTIIGGLADRVGRKKICLAYCIFYCLSCFTKHSTNYNILLLGRILSGISSSILHSAFESWLITEHRKQAYPDEWLSETLSLMAFSKGAVAILSAIIANYLATNFGYVAPFDFAALTLAIGFLVIQKGWVENYGDQTTFYGKNFATGWVILASNPKVMLLGLIQASFEGSMFIFVFSWTPILEATTTHDIPHGIIFASFMVAIMIGAHVHTMLLTRKDLSNEKIGILAMTVSALSLLIPITNSHFFILLGFILFEFCVGMYYPTIGLQRAKHIPNEVRATIMTFFRIPLNFVVIFALLNVSHMTTQMISLYSFLMCLVAVAAQHFLSRTNSNNDDAPSTTKTKPKAISVDSNNNNTV